MVRCLVCGQVHASCGPVTATVGVDQHILEATVGEVRPYTVTVDGNTTVMKLNEEDAERLGGTPVEDDSPSAPAPAAPDTETAKARTVVPNKARPATKS